MPVGMVLVVRSALVLNIVATKAGADKVLAGASQGGGVAKEIAVNVFVTTTAPGMESVKKMVAALVK